MTPLNYNFTIKLKTPFNLGGRPVIRRRARHDTKNKHSCVNRRRTMIIHNIARKKS